ncbi:MAG: DNA helicase RecQ [Flavobacteriales bacterium]|jgi:ATP-dependent DNA helicase RecQ|nr:DNA helicase RecQ [Flavobacteriales bacterium]
MENCQNILENLKHFFGFEGFKGNQGKIIESLLNGHDTFVIMPTGGGKSLCYQLPALMQEGTAIIVSPLIALMKNQVDAIRGHVGKDSVAHVLNSSLNKKEIAKVKEDITAGETKLLYVAPESLIKEEYANFLKNSTISFFAIDEAHCISEWGHDFRPEYRNLNKIMSHISDVPVIALTATATPKVQEDIQKNLNMKNAHVFKSSFNRSNLFYEVRPKKDVIKDIIKFVKQHEGKSGIVYCLSRKKVEEIAETLQVNGIKALPYHAGLDAGTRVKHQDAFLMEDVDVIVATIAFGMGIDKPDVRFVVHHDIPKSLEGYYQETGRAGRDGGEGHCLTFYSFKDIEKLEKFMQNKAVAEQEIGRQLLLDTVAYVESAVCRRKYLLYYFGEDFEEENCNCQCDNCKDPKTQVEGKDHVISVIKTIKETNEQLKQKNLVSIIRGIVTSHIKEFDLENISTFRIGQNKEDYFWNSVVRQMMVKNLIKKEIETYGIIKLTQKGEDYFKNPTSFMVVEGHNYEAIAASAGNVAKAVFDDKLFKTLKDIRKKVAKQKKIPTHVIFQENSLEEMCFHYPMNIEELTKIPGVGMGKAQKFGKPFVDHIKNYVEENNIDRPEDFVVKSIVNKSGLKVFMIKSIDRKMPLEDIADAKKIDQDQLLNEFEHIVFSGTKLNLDYHLQDILDEEQIEEIMDYFMESETDTIVEAYDEFDGDYTEEELRLVRLKFVSEVGN